MKSAMERRAGLALVLGVAAVVLALVPRLAPAQEPKCSGTLHVEFQVPGIPFLSELPYLGRLFACGDHEPCCPDAERLGINFDVVEELPLPADNPFFEGHGHLQVCPLPARQAIFEWLPAASCADKPCAAAAAGCCCAKASAKCGGLNCCAATEDEAKCCAAKCCEVCSCDQKEVAAHDGCKCSEAQACWKRIAELTAAKASLEATVEAREALLEAKEEMYETLADALVENAKLEAKLEMVEHRDEMLKEMVELQAENARLKAQTELAQQKEEILKAQLATVLENERLKQRIAELEQRQGAVDEPVLAAKKTQKAKKTR